jgi:hypothetical protein
MAFTGIIVAMVTVGARNSMTDATWEANAGLKPEIKIGANLFSNKGNNQAKVSAPPAAATKIIDIQRTDKTKNLTACARAVEPEILSLGWYLLSKSKSIAFEDMVNKNKYTLSF